MGGNTQNQWAGGKNCVQRERYSCVHAIIVTQSARLVGWGLTALSAQIGHIVPQRKSKFVKDVYL